MTPQELAEAVKEYRTMTEAASAWGVSAAAISRWIHGSRPIPAYLENVVRGARCERKAANNRS